MVILFSAGIATTLTAIFIDTNFYSESQVTFTQLIRNPVITPLNSLIYNVQPSNLHLHGQHPYYQHCLVNLPQFLGPASLLFTSLNKSTAMLSVASGLVILSVFPHQEARFLLPMVPLVLMSVSLPSRFRRVWICTWLGFNTLLAPLMGVYHQGGIIPAQSFLEKQDHISQAFWWKTYSPPTWLLDGRNLNMTTVDMMGSKAESIPERVCEASNASLDGISVLVAPHSAVYLDRFVKTHAIKEHGMRLTRLWSHRNHINLDDLDFGDDGFLPTLNRVIGRRGIEIWQIDCSCENSFVE